MNEHEIDYCTLGLTEEEYKQKEQLYKEELLIKINQHRGTIKHFISSTFNCDTSQHTLRGLSWNYLCSTGELLNEMRTHDWKIATSKQHVNHLQHFAHAFFLSVEDPLRDLDHEVKPQALMKNWISVEEDELTRLEEQLKFYEHLIRIHHRVTVVHSKCRPITLKSLDEKLNEIINLLNLLKRG